MKPGPQSAYRLYVGNLHHNVTESELQGKFSDFGTVKSVEIKYKKDIDENIVNTFGFVNITTSNATIHSCINDLDNSRWKGKQISLQLAKESFLSRLKREREENIQPKSEISVSTSDKKHILSEGMKNNSKKRRRDSNSEGEAEITKTRAKKKRHHRDSDPETQMETTPQFKRNLLMFGGMQSLLSKEEESPSPKSAKKSKVLGLQLEKELSKQFDDAPKDVTTAQNGVVEDGSGKLSKELVSEKRRIEALGRQQQTLKKQKEAIKSALSSIDASHSSSKKICYSSDEEIHEIVPRNSVDILSGEEEESDENDFRIRPQFEGSKGKKHMELQSRFGSDPRFRIDKRFAEEEDDIVEVQDEKSHQFKILENVLGKKSKPSDSTAKNKLGPGENDGDTVMKKRYEVADNLSSLFKKSADREEFSFLKLFGTPQEEATHTPISKSSKKKGGVPSPLAKNPFRYDSSESEEEEETSEKPTSFAKSSAPSIFIGDATVQPFFFQEDDPRLKEAEEFYCPGNRGRSEEEEMADFQKEREELKFIFRMKMKKSTKKRNPMIRLGKKKNR